MAGSRIKGITIEIGGNTTKLEKALSGVNNTLNKTYNQLRDVDKLLKLDPKNTTLLTQKQEALSTAIGATEDKLKKEKEALEQLKSADQTPEIKDQMAALERQIVADEQGLKNLKKEMKDFGSVAQQKIKAAGEQMQELGGKIGQAGQAITNVGTGLTTHVTAPIVAVGTAAVAAFGEVDKGEDAIIQKTGATGDKLNEMRGIMENLATSIPTDFETAGNAIGEVSTRFGLTGDELEKLTGTFLKFSQLNNTDVTTSIDSVQKALSAFGLDATHAEGLLDAMNATAQGTGVSVDTLATGLIQNATAFQELGLSAEQAAAFMGQMETSGANSETVMNGLRKALKSATENGIPLNEALSNLQNTIANGTGEVDGLTAAYELFGKSGDQIYGAIKNGTLDFNALGTAAEDAGGSIAETFEATLDPTDQFTLAMNDLKILGAELGTVVLEVLTPAIEKARDVVQSLKEKWDELDPGTQEAITKALMIAAVVGPIVVVIGSLVGGISSLIGSIGTIMTMAPLLLGAIAPIAPVILLIIGFIAALVAIGVVLYKNWDKIVEWAGKMKEKISEAWDNIKEKTTELFNLVTEKWNALKDGISNAADAAKAAVTEKWNAMKDAVGGAMETLKSNVEGNLDRIKGKYEEAGGGIKGAMSAAMEGVKILMENEFNIIDSITGGKLSAIRDKFTQAFDSAKNIVQNALNTIKGLFNFDWSLPQLKLPHPRISGRFSLNPPQVPTFSIDWYKKAYTNPVMFTSPTVLPTANGLKGFGDGSGAEIVMSDRMLKQMAGTTNYNVTVNAAPGMDVRQLADAVQQRLAQVQRQKEAVYA